MLRTTARKFPEINVGDNVVVPIAEVDRARGDPRNFAAVVLEVTEDGLYKVGNEKGVYAPLLSRNQLEVVKAKLLSPEDVPAGELSVRAMATASSLSGGQGYTRCLCTTRCKTKRCSCRAAGRLCNSKCHNSKDCTNK
jgi:hypothetical protein